MSLKEKDKRTRLLNEDQNHLTKKVLNISLVMMFLLQIFLPVGLLANASSTGNDSIEEPAAVEVQAHESDVSEDLEDSEATVESPMLMNAQEEEEEKPEEEVADDSNQAEELDTEAKENAPPEEEQNNPEQETEENTDEQPPAPEPKPESEKVEEEKNETEEPSETKKPEVVEDDVEEEETSVEEDEYDPGAMLDGFPATPHPDNPGSIIRYAKGSLGSALALLSGARMMTRNTEGLAPGEVRTSKTATPVSGMVNTWDITVRVEGRDDEQVETTDIVLVIDRSGSMSDNNRMTNAKNAAITFINTMIPNDPNLRIAIVSYSSDYQGAKLVEVDKEFTDDINELTNAVNSLTALGGTHTQAGILQGQELLTGSDADNKHMVLLSDGEPTYSYEPQKWIDDRPSWGTTGGISGNRQQTGVYDGNFNTGTIVGTGSDVTQSYNYVTGSWPSQTTYRRHIHNGQAAIKAGQDARTSLGNSGELFTIAVEAGTVGTSILQDIASPGLAYSTQNPGELQEIYDMIATQISTQYALRAPSVVDEMGEGFTLIESTLVTTEGTASVTPATDSNNQTINWDISPAVTKLVKGTTDVRYAEMTYRVEINDDILNLPGAKTNEHQLFKTNKLTELSYTDTNDKKQTKLIESPKVDPVLMKMKKVLMNPAANENRKFNVQVSGSGDFNHTEPLVPNTDYVWLTNLRHEGTYNVEETSITGDGLTNLDAFNVSYKVDGENKTNFEVNHNSKGKPRGDVTIQVTNKQYTDAIPDDPLIRLSKTFSGLTQDQIDQLTDFKITITSKNDPTKTKDLFLSDAQQRIEDNGDITYKWSLEGWPAGTYTVVEYGEELENYEVVIENDGTVTTIAATINWENALWKKPNTEVNNDLKTNGIPPNIVATKLSQGEGVFVWTETRLSASQRLAVVDALSSYNELGLTMDNGYWYSGDDIAGTDFYFRGHRIQYDFDTGNLHIPQSNQWALIVSGKYLFEGGDPADIAVKNSYVMQTIDFGFTKVDEIGQPLTGAEFKLERLVEGGDPTLIDNTGDDPEFLYEALTIGRYRLTELSAPDGYYLPNDASWIFDVVWDEDAKELTINFLKGNEIDLGDDGYEIANYPKGLLPDTGGPGIMQSITMGMLSFVLLSFMYVWRLKRDEVKRNV